MAYPVAATPTPAGSANPNPAYSGTFIPEIWSPLLLQKFYARTVIGHIANTDWEGEISKAGDKVIIRQIPTLNINDYEMNGPLVFQRPSAPVLELSIDKGKYFNAILDDVARIQSDITLLDKWTDDAGMQLQKAIDTQVLAAIPADISADNKGATAGLLSNSIDLGDTGAPLAIRPRMEGTDGDVGVLDLLVDLSIVLGEQNVPDDGRWCVMPEWLAGITAKSELLSAADTGDDKSPIRSGKIGSIMGFDCYKSNLLPTADETGTTAFWVLAGHSHGLTFASQLTELEVLRSELTFGTILRGLQVYGFKVVAGTSLVGAYVVRA